MPIDVNKQLRHLPFKIVQQLTYCLEPPSDKDWLSLVRVMPEGRFSQGQVGYTVVNTQYYEPSRENDVDLTI